MNTKPILFSTSMVQAILRGDKTQTRRVALSAIDEANKDHPPHSPFLRQDGVWQWKTGKASVCYEHNAKKCPFGQTGDILWVRETWSETVNIENMDNWPGRPHIKTDDWDEENVRSAVIYKADGHWQWTDDDGFHTDKSFWKPSIHMPKNAARIFLRIINVRVEKLHDIPEEDAVLEGVLKDVKIPVANFQQKELYRDYTKSTAGCADARSSFMTLWKSISSDESWNSNPWVWVVEFEQIEKPENF